MLLAIQPCTQDIRIILSCHHVMTWIMESTLKGHTADMSAFSVCVMISAMDTCPRHVVGEVVSAMFGCPSTSPLGCGLREDGCRDENSLSKLSWSHFLFLSFFLSLLMDFFWVFFTTKGSGTVLLRDDFLPMTTWHNYNFWWAWPKLRTRDMLMPLLKIK